eukprot:28619-Amphidinium_carterae.1
MVVGSCQHSAQVMEICSVRSCNGQLVSCRPQAITALSKYYQDNGMALELAQTVGVLCTTSLLENDYIYPPTQCGELSETKKNVVESSPCQYKGGKRELREEVNASVTNSLCRDLKSSLMFKVLDCSLCSEGSVGLGTR